MELAKITPSELLLLNCLLVIHANYVYSLCIDVELDRESYHTKYNKANCL